MKGADLCWNMLERALILSMFGVLKQEKQNRLLYSKIHPFEIV